MNWYGSFEFHDVDGGNSVVVLEQIDADALALFRRIRNRGHVYKISPDEPLATLQIASEIVEQSHGPAPLRFRLSDEMRQEIRKLVAHQVKKPGWA